MLHFEGKHVSVASIYPEKTILVSGISKAFGAGGWRLGFASFPEELSYFLHPMDCIASETFSSVCAPVQYAAIECFSQNSEIENILQMQRCILAGVGKFVHENLTDAGYEKDSYHFLYF